MREGVYNDCRSNRFGLYWARLGIWFPLFPRQRGREEKYTSSILRRRLLDAGVARIEGYIGKALARGRMSQKAADATRAALVPTMDIKDLASCDYVLEAATEDLKTKKSFYEI